ncbi:hypothetical protein ES708_24234 [subsurface metagenome]
MKLKIFIKKYWAVSLIVVVVAYFAFMYFDMYLDSKFDEVKRLIVITTLKYCGNR